MPSAANTVFDTLKAAAHDAPQEPGVYIMRDEESRIIYVGKARVLRNRLSSYFSGAKDIKTHTLIHNARSIETIIVANEYEALLLENTLIKQHSPRYNINLKDGKTYPVIRVSADPFPRVFRTRHIIEDGSRYYGPFPNVQAVDTMLELVDKLFPLRKCRSLKKRKAPCMYFHIGRCAAPCCGKITEGDYHLHVDRVQKLLAGETGSLIIDLTEQMHGAAKQLFFERAAQIRNTIDAIGNLSEGPTVVDFDPEGRDYIAWASESLLTTWSVFSMRGGKMTGRELFRTRSAADETESLETFLASYYSPDRPPPSRIFIRGEGVNAPPLEQTASAPEQAAPSEPATAQSVTFNEVSRTLLLSWFREQFGCEPELLFPEEKRHQAVLAMARQNALEDLRQQLKERGAGPALDELRQALNLRSRPERIEGFDIAQLDGKHPVASLISFKNGIPDKKNYRYFKLRSVVGVVDDFAAMREAVHRRYSRLIKEGTELPDLILIDGGIGQVNAAKGVLKELGADPDLVGLAKRDEELWLPAAREPIRLSKRSEALKLLQHVRDETHRFATGLNQKLRSKDLLFPTLESVEGIGPKRAAAIMKAYGNLPAIAAADPADLAETCGLSEAAARAVHAAALLALQDQAAAKARLTKGVHSRSRAATAAGQAAYPADEAISFLAAEAAEDEFGGE
ncbi:excinuclease ABC, C subunit [Treponema primitia ZAS-2]|uniref:UvrABC system protein C n=1 Tax=Treponema primitia (strain ATCC BAA-887 / DSM 12427 / ZAS-2) TaxID=545694 RepID=F5YHA3_TREPZ|nr:excinuclease ABC subunit UvrC [Treponema primitia]AEF85845.1 excinuclease ABC, C subunit [Treponema primitia ZAS-2]